MMTEEPRTFEPSVLNNGMWAVSQAPSAPGRLQVAWNKTHPSLSASQKTPACSAAIRWSPIPVLDLHLIPIFDHYYWLWLIVPTSITSRHSLFVPLGQDIADSYNIDTSCTFDITQKLSRVKIKLVPKIKQERRVSFKVAGFILLVACFEPREMSFNFQGK